MSTYDAGSISAALTLDRSDFSKGLDQAKADADKFAGKDYTAKVKADTTAADKPLAATQAKADKLGQSSPTVKVNVDNAQATARIAQIQAQIQRLSNIIARPQVSPDTQKAYTQLDALNAELDELSKKQPTAKVEADTADAQAKIDDLNAKLDRLETRDIEVRVKASADLLKAQADLAVLQAQLDSVDASAAGAEVSTGLLGGGLSSLMSPMAALIGVGVALSPILITVGTGLAGFAGAAYGVAKPIEAAATATGGLQANMASLTGPQQQVAQGLLGLEGQFSSFSKALSPQVFSAFNSGLSIASTLLTDAAPVAAATGAALDGILTEVSKGLQDAEWKQFFTFMAQTAGPDVQMLGQAFGAAANALPPLLEALQPIATTTIELTTDFANLVGAVANWGKSNSDAAQVAGTNLGVLGTFTTAVKALVDTQSKGSVTAGAMAALFGDQATATGKAATAAAQAQPSLTNLGDDISVLASDTATAADQTTALTDAWNILVGNFASKETAILNAQSAVQQFGKTVQQQGAGSLAAQQAFEAAAASIGQMVDAEQKAHTPASQMYTDLQNQIKALQASGPLNAEETKQLDGMKQAALDVANSTAGWTTQTKQAAAAIQANLLPQLSQLHANTPQVRTDINNLADSIVNTGNKSASTESDRAKLIKDLENAGVSAKTAQTLVNNLGTAVKNLPAGKALKITMQGDGSYNIVSTVDGKTYNISQGGENSPHATGGLITQGTHGTADDVPARLSRGEWVIKESSSSQYGYGAMDAVNRGTATIGYASGGQVGATSGNLTPGYITGMYSTFQTQMTDAMVSAMQSTVKAATAAAAAAAAATASSGGGDSLLHPSGSGGSVQALMQSMAASIGWTGALWTDLYNVEMREAGFNLTATNPSSGAYGLAQFINGPSEYAQYGGNSTTAAGQITAMLNYIRQRYGTPAGAWAHEQCVPLSVEILTRRGWLTYNQIRESDETVGYNFETGRNEWTPIRQVHVYDDAPLVRLTNKTWEAVCTPNHRWVSRKHEQTRLKSPGGPRTTSRVVEGFVATDKISTRHGIRLAAPADLGDGPSISEVEAELLGWVLGDGSVAWPHKPGAAPVSPSIRLYQSKTGHVEAIDHLVRGMLFNRSTRQLNKPDGTAGLPLVTWQFANSYSAELLKRSGYDHKNPVPFVLSLSPSQREAFMRGVFAAEGWLAGGGEGFAARGYHGYPRVKHYAQNDGPQQDAIILGVYLSGHRPGISERDRRGEAIGRWTISKIAALISEVKPFLGGESIKGEDAGRGSVWCVTTELGSWTMRQGRQVMLTGNSYNWYGGGTGGAKPGWAVTGERGRELVYMRGGETVLPHAATERVMAMHSAGMPGYASGTPNVASLIAHAPSGGWQADVAHLQHVLKVIADSLGIKGLGKTDIAKLKSEQVHDNASLKTSTADLKILTTAKDKITKTTEPALNKQISALNALAGVQKLSAAESSLLKTLKASLAGQQAQLSKINVAINGKPAPAAKAATTTAASSSSSTDSSGTSTAASATTSSGAFTGVLPSAPGLGAPNITGGGTGGLGGAGNATLGVGGFSSGVNASGYQITPSAGSGFQDWGRSSGGFDTSGIEALLQRILAVNQSAPAVTGSSFGASLNGLSRQAAVRSAYSTGAQL